MDEQMDARRAPALPVIDLDKLPVLRSLWRGLYTLGGAMLGLAPGMALALVASSWPFWPALLSTLLTSCFMAGAGWLYAGRSFACYRAQLHSAEGLMVQRGVWWRSEVWVPIARLQNVDISQGPLDRRWGMASLTLHTAGSHDHATSIDGLPVEQAHTLRKSLLAQVRRDHA